MEIYGTGHNVYDAVDAIRKYGVAAVSGTKQPAEDYAKRIIKCLAPYSNITPSIGYENVKYNGYLYYVYNTKKFPIGNTKLKDIIHQIDEDNK